MFAVDDDARERMQSRLEAMRGSRSAGSRDSEGAATRRTVCVDVLFLGERIALAPAENINIATLYKKASPDCPAGAGYPPK